MLFRVLPWWHQDERGTIVTVTSGRGTLRRNARSIRLLKRREGTPTTKLEPHVGGRKRLKRRKLPPRKRGQAVLTSCQVTLQEGTRAEIMTGQGWAGPHLTWAALFCRSPAFCLNLNFTSEPHRWTWVTRPLRSSWHDHSEHLSFLCSPL